jgi:hypothetical protein
VEIKPALVTKRTCPAFLTTCSFVTRNPSSEIKKPVPLTEGFDLSKFLFDADVFDFDSLRGLSRHPVVCVFALHLE